MLADSVERPDSAPAAAGGRDRRAVRPPAARDTTGTTGTYRDDDAVRNRRTADAERQRDALTRKEHRDAAKSSDEARSDGHRKAKAAADDADTGMQMAMGVLLPFPLRPVAADGAGATAASKNGDPAAAAGTVAEGALADAARAAVSAAQQEEAPAAGEASADQLRRAAEQAAEVLENAQPEGAQHGGNDSHGSAAMSGAGQRLAKALGAAIQVQGDSSSGEQPAPARNDANAAAGLSPVAGRDGAAARQNQDLSATSAVAVAAPVVAGSSTRPASADTDGSPDRQSRDFASSDGPVNIKPAPEGLNAAAQVFVIPPAAAEIDKTAAPVAAAPPAAPAEVPDADSAAALIDTIRLNAKPGVWEAKVTLKPEHMGEVTIDLSVEHNNVTAVVRAESSSVREWLHSNESGVRSGLNDQGLNLARFDVEEPEPDRRRDEPPPQQQEQRRKAPRRAETTETRFEITV
jgi:flagellar hook-length control protein FliK